MILLLYKPNYWIENYCRYLEKFNIPHFPLSITDYIYKTKIEDKLFEQGVECIWTIGGKKLNLSDITTIFHYLPNFDISLFHEFVDIDRPYARSEAFAYLMYRLSMSDNVVNPVRPDNLSGYYLQMPRIYKLANESGLKTPKYVVSTEREELINFFRKYPSLESDNLYGFKSMSSITNLSDHAILLAEYHIGAPVIVHLFNGVIQASAHYSEGKKIFHLPSVVEEGCQRLAAAYNFNIAEIYLQRTLKNEYICYSLSALPTWKLSAYPIEDTWKELTAVLLNETIANRSQASNSTRIL